MQKNIILVLSGIVSLVFVICLGYIFTEPTKPSLPPQTELIEEDASLIASSEDILPLQKENTTNTNSLVFNANTNTNKTDITTPPNLTPENPPLTPSTPPLYNEQPEPIQKPQELESFSPPQHTEPYTPPQPLESTTDKELIPSFDSPFFNDTEEKNNLHEKEDTLPLTPEPFEPKETTQQPKKELTEPIKNAPIPTEPTTKPNEQEKQHKEIKQEENNKDTQEEDEPQTKVLQDKLPVPFVEDSLKTRTILEPQKNNNTIIYAELLMDGNKVGLVFEGNKPLKPKTFRLQGPDRVIVDIEGYWILKLPKLISNRMVKDIRSNAQKDKTRIVFDLKTPVTSSLLYRIHSRKYQLVFK